MVTAVLSGLALVIIVALLLLFLQLRFDITYGNKNLQRQELLLVLSCGQGIIRWSKQIRLPPPEDLAENPKKQADKIVVKKLEKKNRIIKYICKLLAGLRHNNGCCNYLLSHVELSRIALQLRLGCGEAAVTACLAGLAAAIQGVFVGYICRKCQSVGFQQQIMIQPDYNRCGLELSYRCIFAVRVVHIIIAAIKLRQTR